MRKLCSASVLKAYRIKDDLQRRCNDIPGG